MIKNSDFLFEQILIKKSMLCVGLDPDISKMPDTYKNATLPLYEFCRDIIDCTHSFAIAYKINVAFFEALGAKGWEQLEKIIPLIPKECFIIADAKRADIGNTSEQYARYYFETLDVDALTLHPYMGIDSLEPFFKYTDKSCIILGLTSNSGSKDFELLKLSNGKYLYQSVIETFIQSNYSSNLMFVFGATHPEALEQIRQICPDHFLLVPGIGAQGGDLNTVIRSASNKKGGLIINVSRNISYPEQSSDYKKSVHTMANNYQKEMASQLKTIFL